MLFAEIVGGADIRQAEPWNAFSVLAALLLFAGIGYLVWRRVRRP
ncbi:MAG TPA: hypothetical protein VJ796_04985 [Acidimicrobiia bacterium]|nr:hypothetical protein [Acidimicrobiia bacterium]